MFLGVLYVYKMTAEDMSLIKSLEKHRSSRVIVYITSDKTPCFNAPVTLDSLKYFREILETMGKTKKISLVLNTRGGLIDTPWPLVNLVREYCDSFEVLVLEKALSAGTLIALGADKVVMLPYSQLSAVDPARDTFEAGQQPKHLEIEDIVGFIDFAKEKVGIKGKAELADVLKELTKELKPTLLGSVNRTHSLIRKISFDLLSLHNERVDSEKANKIVGNLTQKLFSHSHLINRREAKDMIGFGEIIEFADDKTKDLMDALFDFYMDKLEVNKDFDPMKVIGQNPTANYELCSVAIHSDIIKYNLITNYLISHLPNPSGQQQLNVAPMKANWVKE